MYYADAYKSKKPILFITLSILAHILIIVLCLTQFKAHIKIGGTNNTLAIKSSEVFLINEVTITSSLVKLKKQTQPIKKTLKKNLPHKEIVALGTHDEKITEQNPTNPKETTNNSSSEESVTTESAPENEDLTEEVRKFANTSPSNTTLGSNHSENELNKSMQEYFLLVSRILRKNTYYPVIAKRRRIEGRTIANLSISARGVIESINIKTRSGDTTLDKAAIRIIKNSSPLPPPPLGKVNLTVPIHFNLISYAAR